MDTIKTDKNDGEGAGEGTASAVEQPAAETAAGTTAPTTAEEAAPTRAAEPVDTDEDVVVEDPALDADDDDIDAEAELAGLETDRASRTLVLSGAGAIVALGLALASVTGTWLGTLMQQREQLIGQINSQSSAAAKQLAAEFGTPWHATALFNGIFGLIAVIVAAVVMAAQPISPRPAGAPWVRAVAWGALVLGVIGIAIAAFMYFDVFTALPHVPSTPTTGTAPTG